MTALSHYRWGSVGTAGDGFRVPEPRRPTCHRHHVWMAACDDCRDQHRTAPVPPPNGAPA